MNEHHNDFIIRLDNLGYLKVDDNGNVTCVDNPLDATGFVSLEDMKANLRSKFSWIKNWTGVRRLINIQLVDLT